MRLSLFSAALGAATLAFLLPAGARAECASKIRPSAVPRAAALTHLAKEALAAGRFADALAQFERAYCVLPEPILKHGISSAELNLGRCDDALRDARSWLRHAGRRYSAEAREWRKEVLSQCVEVVLDANPGAATVRIDGAPAVPVPWSGRLHAGRHVFMASSTGMLDTALTVDIPAGERAAPLLVSIVLRPPPAAPPPRATAVPARPAPVLTPPVGAAPAPPSEGGPPRSRPLALGLPSPRTSAAPIAPVLLEHGKAAPPAATRPPPRQALRTAGYIGTALGGAALLSAIILGVSAHEATTAVGTRTGTRTTAQADATLSSVNVRATGADALFGIGGALATAGVTLVVVF